MKQSVRISLIILLNLFLISSAFSYKKIKVFVLQPPTQLLPGVKQLAIMDFEGQYGQEFTDRLITLLIMENRGITSVSGGFFSKRKEGKTLQEGAVTNIFDIVERSRLNQVIGEQKLGISGLVDQSSAIELGKVLGVQAVVLGSFNYSSKDTPSKVKITTKQGSYIEDVLKRRVDVSVKFRIIDVETGKILGSGEKGAYVEDKKTGRENFAKLFTVAEGIGSCMNTTSWTVADYLTPCFVLGEYEFKKIKTKPIKKKSEEAAKLAEKTDVDQAYLIYQQLYEQDSYNHRLLYNMGILHEVVGNMNQAQEFYQSALQIKSNEKDYKKAVERIEKKAEYMAVLSDLGVVIKEHSFEFNEAEKQAALAKKVEIKGGEDDRIPVYLTPEKGGKIAARVPGKSTFIVLGQERGFYKIKLLGGKEGYLPFADAKLKN